MKYKIVQTSDPSLLVKIQLFQGVWVNFEELCRALDNVALKAMEY